MKTVHLVNPVKTSNPDAARRFNFAANSWKIIYDAGVIPCPIDIRELHRSSKDIGDSRELPFVKDMIDRAISLHKPDAIIITNADINFFHGCPYKIDWGLQHNEAIFSKRINFPAPMEHVKYETDIPNGREEEYGIDLMGFKVRWWNEVKDYYPDLLLGCEQWDTIFGHFINITNPFPEVKNIIYHEDHEAFWKQTENKNSNPGQVYNIQKARKIHAIAQIISQVKDSCSNPKDTYDHNFLYWVNQLTTQGSSLFDAFIKKKT
jgi:hypothetical protein